MPDALKLGLLLGPGGLAQWQIAAVEAALRDTTAKLALVIQADPQPRDPAGSQPASWQPRLLAGVATMAPAAAQDLAALLADVPTCAAANGADPGAAVAEHGLDMILGFHGGPEHRGLAAAARYGLWCFAFGSRRPGYQVASIVPDLVAGATVTTARLLRLPPTGNSAVLLHEGIVAFESNQPAASINGLLKSCAQWPTRLCREIEVGTLHRLDAPARHPLPASAAPSGLGDRLGLAAKTGQWQAMRLVNGFWEERWSIALSDQPIEAFLDGRLPDSLRWLPEELSPLWCADPFGLADAEPAGILAEGFDMDADKGLIVFVPLDGQGGFAAPRIVMETPHHMSYPYLFRHDGAIYCVPETYQDRRAALYRALAYPDRWEHVCDLVSDAAIADSTIFQHEDRWWLLCGDVDDLDNTKLFGFYADALTGPWTPHPLNPLKCDSRCSRPAGTPFRHAGDLYRPAQDCAADYGAALVINRIMTLSTTDFEEETVARLTPDGRSRYGAGLHTLSAMGDKTIIDGKRYAFTPGRIVKKIRKHLPGGR